jgi:tape measure domain-containing protein
MVTENVDIRFRETGARVIKRRIDEIGLAANSATRGIFLMQRALFVLGGAGILRGLTRQLDTLTEYENRLRLTATSASNLDVVQRRLFQTARDSRTGFEAVAEIYSRTALSVRELGISQAETVRFSESLSKATIISGASAREAHAALVQLGQGMASNTLRGDELRSVLEQLPYVADIISQSLGVTRGELRILGEEGKISAETILKAFREAEKEIDTLFANTIPTISQALSVAGTNWLEFLDALDDAVNLSENVAKSIILISDNITELAVVAGVVGAVLLGMLGTKVLASISAYIVGIRAASVASTRMLEIEQLRAASEIRRIGPRTYGIALRETELRQNLALIAVQKTQLQQTVLDTQFTVANGKARTAATGQFVNLTAAKANLARVTAQLSIVEKAEIGLTGTLATVRTTQTGATNALAAANVRLTAAQAAAGTVAATLTRVFPTLTAMVVGLGRAIGGLIAALGPIGLIAIAITSAVFALSNLRDASAEVNVVVDKTSDLMRQVGAAMVDAKDQGVELADTFDRISIAQLQLQRVEALEAQRNALAAVSDQLIGYNSLWTDAKTILTADFDFSRAINQLVTIRDELEAGSIDIFQFSDRIASLASEVDNTRFTKFVRGLVDSIESVDLANDQVEILDAVIAELNGTATAAETALLVMAGGLDAVSSSAGAAAGAIEFFIGKIPSMLAASKIAGGLQEASAQLASGMADLDSQFNNNGISVDELINRQANLNDLYRQAVSEIDGSAEATRDATAELDRYVSQANVASRTGLDKAITRETEKYEALRSTLVSAGASLGDLAIAEAAYNSTVSRLTNDVAVDNAEDAANALERLNNQVDRYGNQANLASLTGLDRTLAQATQGYETHRAALMAAGASTDQLAEAERNYQTILAGARRDAADKDAGGGGEIEKNFANILSGMNKELDLLKLTSQEREIAQGILKIEEELKRSLTEQEISLASATMRSLEVAKESASIYEEIKGPLDSYTTSLEALYLVLDTGRISQDAFNVSLASLNQTILETVTQSGDGSFADGFLLGISKMTEAVRTFAASSGEVFSDFFGSLTTGFADSVGKAIVFSENLGQALKSVAQNALASLISGLVEMGIQALLNAALGQTIAAAATAASVATAATTAAAWAPAAALASLATLGTNAAPAAAAIASTVALSTGLAAAGGFAEGGLITGPGGPKEDKIPAWLSNREFVVNADATSKNLPLLKAINSGMDVSRLLPSFASGSSSDKPNVTSGGMKVSVHNYTGQNVKVEQISEGEIRIIAGEEAEKKVTERTPEIVAGQLVDSNSQISSAFSENTTAERRR